MNRIFLHAGATPAVRLCLTPAKPCIVLALAAGKWTAYYAASCLDGSAVAVQHWAGEVER